MQISLPDPSLVVLVGATASGKRTFAARHFPPDAVLRGDTLERLLEEAGKRLARGLLTVVPLPGVHRGDWQRLAALAREYDLTAVAVVLDLPRPLLEARLGGTLPPAVLAEQVTELHRTLGGLPHQGFRQVWALRSPPEVEAVRIRRVPLPPDRRDLRGPFDFIGDVHGCLPELRELLERLGYTLGDGMATPPPGRTAVFLGDLTDRGPDSAGVLRLVLNMVRSGVALWVPGNHDEKLKRALDGKAVKALHGLDGTLRELAAAGPDFRSEVTAFIGSLPSHLVLDGGRVVAAHAGLPQRYQGRVSGRVRSFALYGDVNGRTDTGGLPIRRDWAREYRGEALVVYGHTPVQRPRWLNGTVNIDTGCAFGGALTALRYPERETVSVPARQPYAAPRQPFLTGEAPDVSLNSG